MLSNPSIDPLGTFEAQTMVRRMRTYTIVEAELKTLWSSTLMTTVLLFFATLLFGFAINCLITKMTIPDSAVLPPPEQALFLYGPRIGFVAGAVFFLLAAFAWWFGYSVIRDVRQTSREGRLLSG